MELAMERRPQVAAEVRGAAASATGCSQFGAVVTSEGCEARSSWQRRCGSLPGAARLTVPTQARQRWGPGDSCRWSSTGSHSRSTGNPSRSDVELFLAEYDGSICLVYGTATLMDKHCTAPRVIAQHSNAIDIPTYHPSVTRVALIPDSFAAAASNRAHLGTYRSNLLVIGAEAPAGNHVLTDDHGNELLIYVQPPWTDPMAASRTDPPVNTGPDSDALAEPPYGGGVNVGTTYDYSLYVHCGVEWAQIDGV